MSDYPQNGAPTARNMKARGKREAKRSASPRGTYSRLEQGLKGRNTNVITRLQRWEKLCLSVTRGDALAALRACPWLPYVAPLALSFNK